MGGTSNPRVDRGTGRGRGLQFPPTTLVWGGVVATWGGVVAHWG